MEPLISVVLVTYHSRTVLPECLASLAACEHRQALELIVVDNDSRDGTVEWLRSEWPQVRVIANPDNRGFASAVNQGLAIARGEALLLLNPDSRVSAEALAKLHDVLRADAACAVVAPRLLDDAGVPTRSCGRFPSLWTLTCEHLGLARLFPSQRLFDGYKYGGIALERLDHVDWASGAALLLQRRAYEAVGGLDSGFFMYMEEVDWCRRARAAGWNVRFVPGAAFVHSGQHASKGNGGRTYLHNLRSRVRYFRKHHGALAAAGAKLILCASLALKWLGTRLGVRGAEAASVYVRGLGAVWAA